MILPIRSLNIMRNNKRDIDINDIVKEWLEEESEVYYHEVRMRNASKNNSFKELFKDIQFPKTKEELLEISEIRNFPKKFTLSLKRIPDKKYLGANDLNKELEKVG
jgi:hypothetical protein